mmetsp:Transcript_32492/g.79520  ORF Transcript_32492/g.79520 Transcript_32492/m.79520 type:complete len:196 (+) Transcript_32492:84-671(+)
MLLVVLLAALVVAVGVRADCSGIADSCFTHQFEASCESSGCTWSSISDDCSGSPHSCSFWDSDFSTADCLAAGCNGFSSSTFDDISTASTVGYGAAAAGALTYTIIYVVLGICCGVCLPCCLALGGLMFFLYVIKSSNSTPTVAPARTVVVQNDAPPQQQQPVGYVVQPGQPVVAATPVGYPADNTQMTVGTAPQ